MKDWQKQVILGLMPGDEVKGEKEKVTRKERGGDVLYVDIFCIFIYSLSLHLQV